MVLLTSKLLTQFAMPLGIGGLSILFGLLALVFRRTALGSGLAMAGLFWIWFWATPVLSDWVRLSLEGDYPPSALSALPDADAIVVLGGSVESAISPRLFPDLNHGADRVWHTARLYHAGKAPLIVVSGGRMPWHPEDGSEAEAMLAFLGDLGVPSDRVILEGRSSNTRENAVKTRRLLEDRGIVRVLLVTSALHMRRAEATFRAAGVAVVPVATDHEVVTRPSSTLLDYLPDARALEGSSRAFKECLGLWVYRMRGWAAWE